MLKIRQNDKKTAVKTFWTINLPKLNYIYSDYDVKIIE